MDVPVSAPGAPESQRRTELRPDRSVKSALAAGTAVWATRTRLRPRRAASASGNPGGCRASEASRCRQRRTLLESPRPLGPHPDAPASSACWRSPHGSAIREASGKQERRVSWPEGRRPMRSPRLSRERKEMPCCERADEELGFVAPDSYWPISRGSYHVARDGTGNRSHLFQLSFLSQLPDVIELALERHSVQHLQTEAGE